MIRSSMTNTEAAATVIALDTDLATAEAVARWHRERPTDSVIAVFGEAELADVYRGWSNTRAVAWMPVLAAQVARQLPPSVRECVAPPPIVIGDGPIACHLVSALVRGWSEPGQPMQVHCIGDTPDWAQEADAVTRPHGEVSWSALITRPVPVIRRIRELVAQWPEPAVKHATSTGPTVLVALARGDQTLSLAAAIDKAIPNASVGAIVADRGDWPPTAGVTVFDITEAKAAAVELLDIPTHPLAEQLLAEIAWIAAPDSRVTSPKTPIFVAADYGPDGAVLPLEEQDQQLRDQLDTVCGACAEILHAGNLEFADASAPIEAVILTPGELSGMADEILRALGIDDNDGARLTAIELAYLLPGILSRAGMAVQRVAGYEPILTFKVVEQLAPLVHFAYLDISAETNNATDSPLAYLMWEELSEFDRASNRAVLVGAAIGHAVLGLGWRSSQRPVHIELSQSKAEILAELEHRRWAIHQRRNGANSHQWMLLWDGPEGERVTDEAKRYDRHIAIQVIRILADAGIELYFS
jgi:hypothetical protein